MSQLGAFKQVTEAEARKFVDDYPKSKLEWNVTTICEPPMGNYNDFSLGNWPESMVVKVVMNDNRAEWEWFIKIKLENN